MDGLTGLTQADWLAHLELVRKKTATVGKWFLFIIERRMSVAIAIQLSRGNNSTRESGFFDDMWVSVMRRM